MSDELQTPIEGTIVNDRPFEQDEARAFMDRTLQMLRDGIGMQEQAQKLLEIGARREIWKTLGFASWEDCLTQGIAETFTISMTAAARMPLVANLRKQLGSTTSIAKAVGVVPSTVTRDLQAARAAGLLDDEPDRVVGGDGRARPTVRAERRRPAFDKSWGNAVETLRQKTVSFERLREDTRYGRWIADVSVSSRADIERAHAVLGQILKDFEITPALTQDPEN